jgi:hypothetical protein
MANISNVINVALLAESEAAAADNMNVCAVVTSEQGVLSSSERYRLYTSSSDVEADFGTAAKITKHANVFFAQSPNPVQMGGYFVAGYWRGAEEEVAATAGALTGTQLSESTLVDELQGVTDGSFSITIDGGVAVNVTGLDFSVVTEFSDIVTLLDTAITGATVTEDDQKIVITSDTTGATSTVSYMTEATTGTFIGDILTLSEGSGCSIVAGEASGTLAVETKVEAMSLLKAEINIKGAVFIDNPTDLESKALATWAAANSVLMYDVFDSADNLEVATDNVVWDIKLSGLTEYRMMYSKTGNRKLATGVMARQHTVDFDAENSAMTMHLKEIAGVAAEEYSQTEITKAKRVGLDIYTTIKDVSVVLTSGANDFADNVYNLIAYVDSVQTDTFNLLKTSATKIPQTVRGVKQVTDCIEKTTRQFVRAGAFAPGTWTLTDFFGDIDVFNRNIETFGFYVKAGELSDQSTADRQSRKSPTVQVAVKNAGAIHSVDIIINFNL